jgi:hypothetical protein
VATADLTQSPTIMVIRSSIRKCEAGSRSRGELRAGPFTFTDLDYFALGDSIASVQHSVHWTAAGSSRVLPDGVVKVLDFGLAKAASGNAATADLTQSPTIMVIRSSIRKCEAESRSRGELRAGPFTFTDLDYFALGDSIASGHGLMDDYPQPCRRSVGAYPHLQFS